jgi:hypothetical protein
MTKRLSSLLALAIALAGCDAFGGDSASAGLYPAVQNGERVLIDRSGRVVVDLDDYNAVRPGAEGLTPARRWTNGRNVWDYFEDSGEVAFSVVADEAWAPREGRARVRTDGKFAFVDLDGRFLLNPSLNDARDFSEGRARVKTTSWRWGFLDRSGAVVVEPDFEGLGDLRDGRARFERDGKVGFVDEAGKVVIEPVYDAVRIENDWEYIDADGDRVIGPQFDDARPFEGGRAAVEIDGMWTFVRPDGSLVRDPSFDEVEDFSGGLAAVVVAGQMGYVDEDGEYVWFPRD